MLRTDEEYKQLAIEISKSSIAKKRKVGAVVVSPTGLYAEGFNHNIEEGMPACEDENGNTLPTVIHAEVDAINRFKKVLQSANMYAIYVTHPPCEDCQKAIEEAGITKVIIAEQFMKFDAAKLRYDLIPVSSTKALAEVFTYGAKKYKPYNYLECKDKSQFTAALMRHIEAWRGGEETDSESGLLHLAHALTNISILIEFEAKSKI